MATRPLTPHATGVLRALLDAPVRDRLTREPNPLAEIVELPSPYKTHKDGTCNHLSLTAAGRDFLRSHQ